jgi:hypothetical protein
MPRALRTQYPGAASGGSAHGHVDPRQQSAGATGANRPAEPNRAERVSIVKTDPFTFKSVFFGVASALIWGCVQDVTGQAASVGIKKIPGVYIEGTNGQLVAYTGGGEMFWPGEWKESTNGLRVQLLSWREKLKGVGVSISVGSTVRNQLGGLFGAPDDRFEKFELRSADGHVVLPKKGVTMEGRIPQRISISALPRWPDGGLKNGIGFFTNGPPAVLRTVYLNDVYQIRTQGVYVLKVNAVVYRFETTSQHLIRMVLPSVETKINLP